MAIFIPQYAVLIPDSTSIHLLQVFLLLLQQIERLGLLRATRALDGMGWGKVR